MLEGEVPDDASAAFRDDISEIERDSLLRRSFEAVSTYTSSNISRFTDIPPLTGFLSPRVSWTYSPRRRYSTSS